MPKTRPAKPTPRDNAPDDSPVPAGSQEKYDLLLPEALKIPAEQVRPLRADINLAVVNAQRGVEAVLGQSDRLQKELPGVSVASISGLSEIGLALAYAAGQVERWAPAQSDVKSLLATATELRSILLASADALARVGILSPAAVAKIHEGHGSIDIAGDCIALAALFTKSAEAVRGKSPVSAAQIREAAEVGTRLIALLRPGGTRRKSAASGDLATATNARDRLWTLFERTWEDQVWRAGAWLFGRKVDSQVPPLQSRVLRKRGAKPPKPTPGGTP